MNKKWLNITFSIILISLVSLPQLASAHFHYDLSVSTHLQANAKQQLTSIKMIMTYGDMVSDLMLQDQKNTKELGKQLTDDLEKLHYFTVLKLNNKVVETAKANSYQLKEIKHKDYSNLQLTLTLPLKTPISLKGNNTLEINHEDVTASAIIFYEDPTKLSIDQGLNKNCKVNIKEKETFEEGESPQIVKVICTA